MKSWLKNWKRKREIDVERQLRARRPQASDSFVRTLASRINPRPVRPVRTRTRLGIAAVVTASMAAVLGATGGFSSAASSVLHVTQGVAHVAGVSNPKLPPKPGTQPVRNTAPSGGSACAQYSVAPTISGFSPSAGKAGALVTVSGTGFIGASQVTEVDLGAEPVSFILNSSTSLTFTVPSDAAGGPQTISVTNCPGTATSTDSFTVWVAPSITAINPTHGGYGTSVAITGSGLTSTSSVKFTGGKAGVFSFVDDTEVDVTVPVGAKTGPITLTNAAGSTTSPAFTVDLTAPTVTGFSPLIGVVGDSVTITGTNFIDGEMTVSFNGTDSTSVTFNSATSLTATVPVGATSGQISVDNGGGAALSAKSFTVVGTPVIDSFKPIIGVAGTTSVTILGHSFTGTTTVDFNGIDATGAVVKGDTQITVKVPVGATTGPISITNGVDTGTSADDFTVIQAPDITSANPTEGGFGTSVTLTGTGFSGVTKVTFNGKTALFDVVDDTEIDTSVPAGAPTSGTGIVVTNAKGSSAPEAFTVISGAPTVSKFAPASGAEGENVVLTGTNLAATLQVQFGGGATQTFDNSAGSATSVTIEIPAGAETGQISVDNGVGVATTKASFTVLAAPVIVGFTPAFGKVGTKVTIVGDNLIGASEVDFGAGIAKPTYNKKDGSISAVVPKTATTDKITVKVKTPAGAILSGDSGNGNVFTLVTVKPTIDDLGTPFSPSEAVAGDDITITGTGFVGPMSVKFNGKLSPFVSVTDSTHLVARVPEGATSGVVMVTNIAGPFTSKTKLLLTEITGFSPTKGLAGKVVSIVGTHLAGATDVSFNGTSATISSNSDTKIVVTVPVAATSGFITVTTSAGTATSPKSFTVG